MRALLLEIKVGLSLLENFELNDKNNKNFFIYHIFLLLKLTIKNYFT